MRIRPGRREDIRCLREIERAAASLFRSTPHPGLARPEDDDLVAAAVFEAAIRTEDLLVAVGDDDRPLGFALCTRVGDEAHLKELDVHPDAAGRGLGSALLEAVCEAARNRGEPSLSLTTFRDVAFNAPFYARRGFRELAPGQTGPALRAVLAAEAEAGLPGDARCAMRLDLRP